jgi:putative ABC transport system permease protein
MNIGPILRAMKHNRTRVVLIVLEIAMTLAIVTNCVNVILSERDQMSAKSGFDDDNLLTLHIRPFAPEFRDAAFIDNIIDADVRTLESVPGVRAAANAWFLPWEGFMSSSSMFALGTSGKEMPMQTYYGTKDLVQTLGLKLVEGRTFRDGDHAVGHVVDPVNVCIITKAAADAFFPDGHAVGRQIQLGRPESPEEKPMTVVGVVDRFYNPMRTSDAIDSLAGHIVLMPARAGDYRSGMLYIIRCEPGAMQSVAAEIEKRLLAANAGRVLDFKTVPEKKNVWFADNKIVVTTMSCIIVALIGVTALGLLGLTSLSVAERTKQIGTRRALGATRGDILQHFLLENWLITTAGLVLGVAGTYALNLLLVSHVSDVKMGWHLVVGGMVLLWINGLAATIPAALRATLVPPSIATRSV